MRALLILAVAVTAGACEKAPPAEEKPANPAPVATPASSPTDSTTGVKAATDTTATKAATKGEGPLRDSAFGPKYTVDEKGKVTPIKKP